MTRQQIASDATYLSRSVGCTATCGRIRSTTTGGGGGGAGGGGGGRSERRCDARRSAHRVQCAVVANVQRMRKRNRTTNVEILWHDTCAKLNPMINCVLQTAAQRLTGGVGGLTGT